ncbi:MAG: amidohydrolase family protein [Kiloniellales bacterium]
MTRPIPGPDPNPHTPTLKAPPKACDCHNHVFGPAARFPYSPERLYTPPDAPLDDFLRMLGILGIERAVIVQPSVYGSDNGCTEDAIARMAGRARGVAVVDPGIGAHELKRLDAAGFRGLRFNLIHTGGSTSLDALESLAAKAASIDWHAQIYLRGGILPDIEARLQALPVPLVIDHLGHMDENQGTEQLGFRSLLRLVEAGRTWVKLCPYRFDYSGFPYPKAQPFARALAAVAPQRLVWGTDWPHPDIGGPGPEARGPMPNDGDLLDALGVWFEDEALIRRILVDNPADLYRFDARPLGA